MNILTIDNITKSYGERKLFSRASFYLEEGEKVGIIGINGTGKSTLLRMLAGLEEPDEGSIVRARNHVIRFLPQNPQFDEKETVLEAVLREAQAKEEAQTGRETYAGQEAHAAWQEPDRQQLAATAKSMLTRLGVYDFDQPCGQLSGGQKKRLALVSVLLSPAEILVLDEPTNHLDNEMSDWLEDTLCKRKGAVVMVTHDRYFLDSVSRRIIEIDKGSIYSYDANYSGYLELKMQREEMLQASERKRTSILRNELAWVQRGARARSTKQKARLQRYEELRDREAPLADGQVQLSSASSRLGRTTIEIEHLSKAYGEKKLVTDFTYFFQKNDRIGFIGPNGCGKSTLMRIVTGTDKADEGRIEIGQTVKIGYYAQEIDEEMMNPGQRVIDSVRDVAEYVETGDGKISASNMLERFLFYGEEQYGLLGKLSGGERRRLQLLKVLMGAPNVLILDEPTNDLDIATLRILEDYLDGFQGIVMVVSHDRYFLDRTVRRIFSFEGEGRLEQHEGGYTDYRNRKREQEEASGAGEASGRPSPGSPGRHNGISAEENIQSGTKSWKSGQKKKLRFTYQEQKDYETIEADIAALEEKIGTLDGEILKAASDFVKLNQLTGQKEETERVLEEKMNRWMYLEELAARIEQGEMVEI